MSEGRLPGESLINKDYSRLISDARIRQILKDFTPILHKAISEAGSFFSASVGRELSDAIPMGTDEIKLWDEIFGLTSLVSREFKQGKLFVPEAAADEPSLLETKYSREHPTFTEQIARKGESFKKYRVNLEETVWVPVSPFNPDGMKFLIQLGDHLGGQTYGPGLYNAFVDIHIRLKDKNGRWVVDVIPGTTPGVDGPDWGKGPVYSPYCPYSIGLWFNTTVHPDKPNALHVTGIYENSSLLHADLNDSDSINQLKIPKDPLTRLFFWEVNKVARGRLSSVNSVPLLR